MKITINQTSLWSSGTVEDTWEGDQKCMCFIIPVACHFTTNLISDSLETNGLSQTELERTELETCKLKMLRIPSEQILFIYFFFKGLCVYKWWFCAESGTQSLRYGCKFGIVFILVITE